MEPSHFPDAASSVLQQNTTQERYGLQQNTTQERYGNNSQEYQAMVHKWRYHFYKVIDAIHNLYSPKSIPVQFAPIEQYFDGFNITYKNIKDVPQSILSILKCDGEITEGWNWIEPEGTNIIIFFDTDVVDVRQRFTIAHEWAHIVQSFDGEFKADMEAIASDIERSRIIESVANHFAAYYLTPELHVQYELENDPLELHNLSINIFALACSFQVSNQVMEYRLMNVPIQQKQ
jgi:hypothetical protein